MWAVVFKSLIWAGLIALFYFGLETLYLLMLIASFDIFFYQRLIIKPSAAVLERCVTTIDGSSHRERL